MKGKEVKIGLSIIGVLLCVFGAVLFVRLRHPDQGAATDAKTVSKNSKGRPKKTADDKELEAESADAPKLKLDQEFESDSVPSHGLESAATRDSAGKTDQEPEGPATRDAWPEHASSEQPPGRYRSGMATSEKEAGAGDRYGRRYGGADELQLEGSSRRMASGTGDPAVEDEIPAAASDASEDGPLAPAFEVAGDQPADGYRARDERRQEELAGEVAAEDPFPPAARSEFSNRGLPIGGALKKSRGEVELTPVEEADEEPSDDPPSGVSQADRELGADLPWAGQQPGGDGVYFVEANDSFASISKKVYGAEGYFKALHEYNRERFPNPNQIDAGDEIATPDVALLKKNYPKLCPKRRTAPSEPREGAMRLASSAATARRGRSYLVAKGDTLFDIAKRELGKASRWREIYDLNQDVLGADFNYLSPGMELLLPDGGEKPDPVAHRGSYDRRR
ncbi:MAG TPA: LysM domain-containing protein [Pirellulales bacterium]|nr:LysM domain-containing protein [Pirellulales bacterium]